MKQHSILYNLTLTASTLSAAALVSYFLSIGSQALGTDAFVSMIFLLAVFLIARSTDGYVYGVASAAISVLAVNFAFTYPYFAFNFTLTGYPLTILCMSAVSIITSALTSQAKLHHATMLKAQAAEMRGNLLRSVSHDLRTPLTSIVGAASALADPDADLQEELRRSLANGIREDAEWLIRVVENLLSVTRIDVDHTTTIRKIPEVAEEIVAAGIAKFRKRFPDFHISVHIPDDPLFVPMDATLIEQVILNLLENAAIHGKTVTEIAVTVSLLPPEAEKELKKPYFKHSVRRTANSHLPQAVFEIRDNGVGISAEQLPHIFEGHLTDHVEQSRSLGIGLSVCSAIITAHGGKMEAQNDHGAVFRFFLPLDGNPLS